MGIVQRKLEKKHSMRVSDLKVKQLIIDISGVPYVDTTVVNHIFKIVKGIKLLGCSTILTGISPKIADTMIELGVEINDELKQNLICSKLYKSFIYIQKKDNSSISSKKMKN